MAESCTYADLRFLKAPPKKPLETPGSPRAGAGAPCRGDGELTYENVKCKGGSEEIPKSRAAERRESLEKQDHRLDPFWKRHIVHILLLICLILLTTCLALGIQLVQVSKKHNRQSSNFTLTLRMQDDILEKQKQSCWEAQLAVNQTTNEVFHSCQRSLQIIREQGEQCRLQLQTSQEQFNQMVNKLNQTETKLKDIAKLLTDTQQLLEGYDETECCQTGWYLLAGSCFNFSEDEKMMSVADRDCVSKGARLVGNRIWDDEVKEFMKSHQLERKKYWVGLRTNWNSGKWVDSKYTGKYDTCGITYQGQLQEKSCRDWWSNTFQWICEKRTTKIKASDLLQRTQSKVFMRTHLPGFDVK
ncbi:B-cell differentiation antigen CD72 isoform X2 [Ambystoma mexicanum]|uniref:B-cell differentiation antigen CD72 isoform X2 n=1 Tax=Ambystoma mexicanum TaxID=8296 RepID=UPI0037E86758